MSWASFTLFDLWQCFFVVKRERKTRENAGNTPTPSKCYLLTGSQEEDSGVAYSLLIESASGANPQPCIFKISINEDCGTCH